MPKVLVVLGSVREGRNGERVALMVMKALKKQGIDATLLDPKVVNPPILTQPIHFQDPSKAPKWMQDTHALIQKHDAFVVVSGEYNCSIPPALTNILDYFPTVTGTYRHKPASIVTYSMGPFGGYRAQGLVRMFLSELGCVVLPKMVTIPLVHTGAIAENGDTKDERILKNVGELVNELSWYTEAIKTQAASKDYPAFSQ